MRVLCNRLLDWLRGSKSPCPLEPSEDEGAKLRADVSLAMSDIELLTRPEAGPNVLLPRRLELLGLDPAFVLTDASPRSAAMRSLCETCTHWRRCARDLGRGDVQAGLSDYCLNSEAIDQALLERTEPRSTW